MRSAARSALIGISFLPGSVCHLPDANLSPHSLPSFPSSLRNGLRDVNFTTLERD